MLRVLVSLGLIAINPFLGLLGAGAIYILTDSESKSFRLSA